MTYIIYWARLLSAILLGVHIFGSYGGDPIASFVIGIGWWAIAPWWGRLLRKQWYELIGRNKQ
ncbi:hypothetical protein LCGC14_1022700 [marine sediment metagenome]|uniref:Uncharacterized protein n=1 Tax=marine sediment metagenome TaxID=412755 RepID=A0A0F9NIK8_9ZZZZ